MKDIVREGFRKTKYSRENRVKSMRLGKKLLKGANDYRTLSSSDTAQAATITATTA